MDVYICEKPSQAKDLAFALNVKSRKDGFYSNGNNLYITWAYGHLLEMYMPEEYDEKYKSWNIADLPISPASWKNKVKKASLKQYKIIEGLVNNASRIFIATDLDREGEAIARSLLDRFRYKGIIFRVCLTALDEASIQKALENVKDGDATIKLYYAALGRQRADFLVGLNMSRMFTILAKKNGYDQTLHVGRVITPMVALICRRDNEIKSFKPSPYYTMSALVSVQKGQFKCAWVCPEDAADEEGRCINKPYAIQVANQINNGNAVISKAETKKSKSSPPLPFDLSSLQQYASKRWGYTAQQVLDTCQSLYETHKATSYPRTDSRFLPVSQRDDVSPILQNLAISDPSFAGIVGGADAAKKSRAFNDSKVSAHHAIIPTRKKIDIKKLSETEFNIYDVIRRFYLSQFYSDYEFDRTIIEVDCNSHTLRATGNTPRIQGWKVLFRSDDESDPKEEADTDTDQQKLPAVNQGEPCIIKEATIKDKQTRPSPHFTEATLLSAMENISKFVVEPRFKKILKETSGLGTPATRSGIIEGACSKGYIKREKKVIKSTSKARALISVLPEAITSPGLTAAWEEELNKISTGEVRLDVFMRQISKWITSLIEKQKNNPEILNQKLKDAFAGEKTAHSHACFNCGGALRRIKGKNGFFWACQNASCKKTYNDNRNKPVERSQPKASKPGPKCPECEKPMVLRKSRNAKKKDDGFYGCTGFPECKKTIAV